MGTEKKWIPSKFPGVRYRQHPERKHGIAFDRYFAIRYQKDGARIEEGLGWTSEGWTADKAANELAALKKAARLGEGATSLKEKRKIEQERKATEEAERQQQELEGITLSQFFKETYFPQAKQDKKKGSWRTEELLFRVWIEPEIGNKPLKDVSPIGLERIKKRMSDAQKSPRTIHYTLAVVRQIFNRAGAVSAYIGANPVSKVKKPTADNRRMRFLSHEEARELLAELKRRSQQLHDIALVSLHCGCRAGEIFSLTWDCIDLDRGQILVKDPKPTRGTVKSRVAYVTEEVKAMFSRAEANQGLVFPNRKGLRTNEVSSAFEQAVNHVGLNDGVTDKRQKVVFHTLRHTFASWLVEAGVDLYTVKTLLGHSTITMTERYSHLGDNSLRQAVNTLEEAMRQQPKPEPIQMKRF
jgi:integrase